MRPEFRSTLNSLPKMFGEEQNDMVESLIAKALDDQQSNKDNPFSFLLKTGKSITSLSILKSISRIFQKSKLGFGLNESSISMDFEDFGMCFLKKIL